MEEAVERSPPLRKTGGSTPSGRASAGAFGAEAQPEEREALRARLTAEYGERFANPYVAAERGLIDDIIDPRDTRKMLALGLKMCWNRHLERPFRKRGIIPV